jgi:hypothetical protein
MDNYHKLFFLNLLNQKIYNSCLIRQIQYELVLNSNRQILLSSQTIRLSTANVFIAASAILIFKNSLAEYKMSMNRKLNFPENLTDFLSWIKEVTEAYWREVPREEKMHGAKWLPLTDEQIDGLELKYFIKFDVEHRAFLKILHTIDRKEEKEYNDENNEGTDTYEESEEQRKKREFWTPPYQPSLFYNWITEKEWIESRLAWIEDFFTGSILSVNKSWLRSWGPRPESEEEKVRIFREWYHKAPCLLPIKAHTFLMADGGHGLRPVLSVYGFDTIISGWSLRHFLIREFAEELGLTDIYYDEDYTEGYTDLIKGIPELDRLQTISLNEAEIPYWKEVLTYYNRPDQVCWQGFWVPAGKPQL